MLLHIEVSPRGEESFSVRTAEAFLESYRQAHPKDAIRTLDLSAPDAVPEFGRLVASGKYKILSGQEQTPQEKQAWKAVEDAIADFKGADKLVISCPMWNFGIPYRLKQYVDVIAQPGYTFSYSPEAGYKGLVTGKPALLILARGGSYAPGSAGEKLDLQKPYLETILGFIGFTDIDTIIVEPTLLGGPDVAQQKLDEAIAIAREKAKVF